MNQGWLGLAKVKACVQIKEASQPFPGGGGQLRFLHDALQVEWALNG